MRFIDEIRVRVEAGNGGDGAIAFRREKYVPFGGPSGGDGGRGGNVVFEGNEGMSTLFDLTYERHVRAERGQNGANKDRYGRKGRSRLIRVPLGTQFFNDETDEAVGEIVEHEQQLIIAHGGRGGKGNIHFATPTDRAPRKATPGTPGEKCELRLELKVMADVGLLGFPNAGKSTFVSVVSAARPKVADYPFTTLVPSLGVVTVGGAPQQGGTTFVVADIPGLIAGASDGAGLGHRFLRHVERTRALLHLLTLDPSEEREPLADYRALRLELEKFDPKLSQRPEVVALSKLDLPEVKAAFPELKRRFAEELGVELLALSTVTREGLQTLVDRLAHIVVQARAADAADDPEENESSLID